MYKRQFEFRVRSSEISYADVRVSPIARLMKRWPVFVVAGSCRPELPLFVYRSGQEELFRELLPRIGRVKLVQCNFSQYSSRYDAFCKGETPPVFDPNCAGGALMDLGVYNVSYIVGLFGEPNQVKYTANIERSIDTSGILTMEYSGFRAVSIAAKDCAAPARYVIQGTKGYILQKSTANFLSLIHI